MTKFLLTLATLSLLIVSCKRMQKTPGGLEYKIYTSNTGDKIAAGDLVFFKLIAKVSDSVLFNTYKNTHVPNMNLAVRENFAKGNFEEGLTLLTTGDSALFMISADSFFQVYIGSPAPPFIKKGERISFNIKVDSFISKKVQAERKTIQELEMVEKQKNEALSIDDYVAKSGVKYTKTASGVYYIITKATKGAMGAEGDLISANYTGKLFSGKEFDSNSKSGKPFEFQLGTHQVIAGWDEIFALLHEGEKATVIIPSALAYGAQGAGEDIGPFTPLTFDVELLKITKTKK